MENSNLKPESKSISESGNHSKCSFRSNKTIIHDSRQFCRLDETPISVDEHPPGVFGNRVLPRNLLTPENFNISKYLLRATMDLLPSRFGYNVSHSLSVLAPLQENSTPTLLAEIIFDMIACHL